MSTLPNEVREKALLEMKLAPWPLRNDNYADRDKYVGKIFDAALSALEAAGWVCVPVEPTQQMLEAAASVWGEGYSIGYRHPITKDFSPALGGPTSSQIYAAMLTASNPKEKPMGSPQAPVLEDKQ